MRRALPFVVAVCVLVGLAYLLRTAKRYDPGAAGDASRAPSMGDVSVRVENAEIISRQDGKPLWELRADHIALHSTLGGDLQDFRSADFRGIRKGVLYRSGKPEAFFSAGDATYDNLARRFDIRGKLRLRSVKGDRLDAEACQWSEQDDFVRVPGTAEGVFRGNKLTAPTLLYSPRRDLLQCPLGAEGTVDGYHVRATALFWDMGQQWIRLPGPVTAERDDLSFGAQSATMDLRAHRVRANNGQARVRIESDGY